MSAKQVNQKTIKMVSLKKLAKEKKKISGGDSGILTKKGSNTFR